MVRGKLCLPGDDVVNIATLSMTNEESDPNYQVEQIQHPDPSYVAKATGPSTVITVTLPGNVTLKAVSIHNTNATTASIASGAGLSQVIAIPALDPDGQRRGGWKDLDGVTGATDDVFTVTLSVVSGVVWVGRIALWVAARAVNWEEGRDEGVLRPGNVAITTRLGSIVHDDQGIRTRWFEMTFTLAEDAAIFRALEMSAKGAVLPFALVPDELVNDALWVNAPEAYTERLNAPGFASIPRRFVELSGGPPNG